MTPAKLTEIINKLNADVQEAVFDAGCSSGGNGTACVIGIPIAGFVGATLLVADPTGAADIGIGIALFFLCGICQVLCCLGVRNVIRDDIQKTASNAMRKFVVKLNTQYADFQWTVITDDIAETQGNSSKNEDEVKAGYNIQVTLRIKQTPVQQVVVVQQPPPTNEAGAGGTDHGAAGGTDIVYK